MKTAYNNWILNNRQKIIDNLLDYLSIETTSPNEEKAFPFIHKYLQEIGFKTWEQSFHNKITNHPNFCPSPPSKISSYSRNIHAKIDSEEAVKTVLVSCHIDVVPRTSQWPEAFIPCLKDKFIYGRGACDNKANLIMFAESLRFLNECSIPLKKNVIFDGVIEEEIGGNGALSAVMQNNINPYGVIVLEPTSLKCFRGHRGCLGFSITASLEGTHMGTAKSSRGPAQAIANIINDLTLLEARLIKETRLESAFDIWPRPIQINVGGIEGGEWHGSTMTNCRILVNMGFPPSYNLEQAKVLVYDLIKKYEVLDDLNYKLNFDGIRNEGYLCDQDSEFIKEFIGKLSTTNIIMDSKSAWSVSCDARLYANLLKVPTIIFGCGDLSDAHSAHEKIDLTQIFKGILGLAVYFSQD